MQCDPYVRNQNDFYSDEVAEEIQKKSEYNNYDEISIPDWTEYDVASVDKRVMDSVSMIEGNNNGVSGGMLATWGTGT